MGFEVLFNKKCRKISGSSSITYLCESRVGSFKTRRVVMIINMTEKTLINHEVPACRSYHVPTSFSTL